MSTNPTYNPDFVDMTNGNDIAGPPGSTVGGVKTPQMKAPKVINEPNPAAPPGMKSGHIDPAVEGFKGGPSGSFAGTAP